MTTPPSRRAPISARSPGRWCPRLRDSRTRPSTRATGQPDERPDRRVAPAHGDRRAGAAGGAPGLPVQHGGVLSAQRSGAVQSRPGDPLALLARGAPRAVYLLHGDESYLIERALAGLRARVMGAARILWAPEDSARLPAALDDLASPM